RVLGCIRSAVDLTEYLCQFGQCRCRGFGNNNRYLRAIYALTVVTDLCSIISTCNQCSCRCQGSTTCSRCVPNHIARSACRIQIRNRSAVDLTENLGQLRQCRCRGFGNNNRYLRTRYALTVVTDLCSIICTCNQCSCRCQGSTTCCRCVPTPLACSACRIRIRNRSAVDLTEHLGQLRQGRCWGFGNINRYLRTRYALTVVTVLCSIICPCNQCSCRCQGSTT